MGLACCLSSSVTQEECETQNAQQWGAGDVLVTGLLPPLAQAAELLLVKVGGEPCARFGDVC